MQVVRYRPYLRLSIVAVLVLVVAGGIAGSYKYGILMGTGQQAIAIEERDRLLLQLKDSQGEAEEFRQRVANLNLGAEVDRQANEGVRLEVMELKNQIAALEEDITFYRGLMSPNKDKSGLTIGSLDVLQTPVPRIFEYKLVVQQLAANHKVLNGFLNFVVIGTTNGIESTLNLKDLSDKVTVENIKLRFRYFQNFTGQIKLPDGFEPIRIELVAKSTGKTPVTVSKKFGWLVQES